MPKAPPTDDAKNCATAWFVVLERARIDNDFARAAYAEKQLARLGVRVRFLRRASGRVPGEAPK